MGNAYNIAAAVGRVSTYITAVLTTLMAMLCVLAGSSLIRSPEKQGEVVQGRVTGLTEGCDKDGWEYACTHTVVYTYEGKQYTVFIPSAMSKYAVGDAISVRVSADEPEKGVEDFPSQTFGWALLSSAIVSVCIAISLTEFAEESKNFAAGAGGLTFIQAVLGIF
jgi:hypothetical protein